MGLQAGQAAPVRRERAVAGRKIWYRRTVEVQDRAVTVEFEDAQGVKAAMDPVVVKMSACLAMGRSGF